MIQAEALQGRVNAIKTKIVNAINSTPLPEEKKKEEKV